MTAVALALALGCRPADPDGEAPPAVTDTGAADTGGSSPPRTTGDTAAPTGDTGTPPAPGPCGELVSAVAVGGPEDESLQVLGVAADGGVIAGGYFTGALTLDPGGPAEETFAAAGYSDGLVLRYAPDGTLAWARQLASITSAVPEAFAGTSDGGVLAAGKFYGTATFAAGEADAVILDSFGESDGYVARFDAAGGLSWVARFGGAAHDFAIDLAVLPGDEVVVVGLYRGDATFGPGEPGETTLALHPYAFESGFVARLGGDGQLRWVEALGGTQYARADAAAVDPITGEVVVAGLVSGPGVATLPGATPFEIDPVNAEGYLARWDPDGGALAVTTFGGYPKAVDVAPDGTIAVGGGFYGEAVFGAGEADEEALTTESWYDGFAAAFAPDLTLSWAAQTLSPPEARAEGRGVAATVDGGAVLSGDFTDRVRLGAGEPAEVELITAGAHDPYLARFDGSGRLVCAAHLAGPGGDLGVDVVRLPDGRFASTGQFDGEITLLPGTPFETTLSSAGESDGFLATFVF